MARQLPGSVMTAIRALWALLAVGVVATVVTVLMRDDLELFWADRHKAAREYVERGGLDALRESGIKVPAFVPVVAVLFVVIAMIVLVLMVFLREGHEWARISLTVLAAALLLLAVIVGVRYHPPVVFVVLAGLVLVLDGVLLASLWHKDTTAYLRGPWLDGPA